jgi:hypothetical protein
MCEEDFNEPFHAPLDNDIEIVRENIEDREINTVQVVISTESGCNASEGEYSIYICSFIGALDLTPIGGVDDISLIKECIENDLDFDILPKEGSTSVTLEESGEWEDVFWHKYYKITRVIMHEC